MTNNHTYDNNDDDDDDIFEPYQINDINVNNDNTTDDSDTLQQQEQPYNFSEDELLALLNLPDDDDGTLNDLPDYYDDNNIHNASANNILDWNYHQQDNYNDDDDDDEEELPDIDITPEDWEALQFLNYNYGDKPDGDGDGDGDGVTYEDIDHIFDEDYEGIDDDIPLDLPDLPPLPPAQEVRTTLEEQQQLDVDFASAPQGEQSHDDEILQAEDPSKEESPDVVDIDTDVDDVDLDTDTSERLPTVPVKADDTLALLAQLDQLNIQDNKDNYNFNSNPQSQLPQEHQQQYQSYYDQVVDYDDSFLDEYSSIYLPNGDVQPWLYCQPCSTTPSSTATLPQLSAPSPLLDIQEHNNNNNNNNNLQQQQQQQQQQQSATSLNSPATSSTTTTPLSTPFLSEKALSEKALSEKAFLEPWNYADQDDQVAAVTDIDKLLQQLSLERPPHLQSNPEEEEEEEEEEEQDKEQKQQEHQDDETIIMKRAAAAVDSTANDPASSCPHTTSHHARTKDVPTNTSTTTMQTLLESFGVTASQSSGGNEGESSSSSSSTRHGKQKSKLCLGHRERILGVDISPDGQYFATASADATIRVWQGQKLLATLRGHDDEHESLRVAWATEMWASRLTQAARQHSPLQPGHDVNLKLSVPTSPTNDTATTANKATIDSYRWLATAAADGVVHVWSAPVSADSPHPTNWQIVATLDHAHLIQNDNNDDKNNTESEEEPDTPQIYGLQWIDDWQGLPPKPDNDEPYSFLLTSSDDHVHLWDWNEADGSGTGKRTKIDDGWSAERWQFREMFSVRFAHWQQPGYGCIVGQVTGSSVLAQLPSTTAVASCPHSGAPVDDDNVFGGKQRNPQGIIYVFDAAYSPYLATLGVALSDGTVRLLNGRGTCYSVLQLPHVQAHLTALAWSGHLLATAVATGEVVTWQVVPGYTPTCLAIYAGGHTPGRPVFGVGFYGHTGALLSWGMDGRLCVWDTGAGGASNTTTGTVNEPVATLMNDAEYPLYAVAVSDDKLVAAGGGTDGGLIGIPIHLYNLEVPPPTTDDNTNKVASSFKNAKAGAAAANTQPTADASATQSTTTTTTTATTTPPEKVEDKAKETNN